jgi:F-box and leucine-rich repeat protein 2/20
MNPPNWESSNPFPSSPSRPTLTMSPDKLHFITEQSSLLERKGKGSSTPVQIPSSSGAYTTPNDLFSISLDSDSPSGSSLPGPSSLPPIQHEHPAALQISTSQHDIDDFPYNELDPPYLDKGKARDTPPILPPLTFPPMSFDICPSPSLISETDPSSYGSLCTPHIEHDSPSGTPPALHSSATHGITSMLATSLTQRRSLSNPVFRHPDHLIASSADTRVKIEPFKYPNELPHNRSSSNGRQTRSVPSSPGTVVHVPINFDAVETGSCLAPWKREFKPRSKDKFRMGSHSCIVLDRVGGASTSVLPDPYPVCLATRPVVDLHSYKANTRSYSDPFPLPQAFDVVPTDSADAFVPIPFINPPNFFDEMLPRELRLRIFSFLIEHHEEGHARRVRESRWTANKASKHKWVGRNQGVRELVRLGRVSMRSIILCSLHGRHIPRSGLQGLVVPYL